MLHFAALSYIMQGISHPSRRNTGIVSRTGRTVNRYSKNQNILPSIFPAYAGVILDGRRKSGNCIVEEI